MIIETNKDILLATEPVIGHCCNTQNTMGSGVAKALKDRFPEIYTADTADYLKYGDRLLGMSRPVKVITRPKQTDIQYVVNMYGQVNYGSGRQLNYEAIYTCLEHLRDYIEGYKFNRVGLPWLMGSNRAGGYWPIVYEMIDHIFDIPYITVNLYRI